MTRDDVLAFPLQDTFIEPLQQVEFDEDMQRYTLQQFFTLCTTRLTEIGFMINSMRQRGRLDEVDALVLEASACGLASMFMAVVNSRRDAEAFAAEAASLTAMAQSISSKEVSH